MGLSTIWKLNDTQQGKSDASYLRPYTIEYLVVAGGGSGGNQLGSSTYSEQLILLLLVLVVQLQL